MPPDRVHWIERELGFGLEIDGKAGDYYRSPLCLA
jgi:hypothetical protein